MGAQELQRNEVTPDVEALIDRVRTAHREAQAQADKAKEYASKAIDRAFEAGDLLLILKPTVKHGQWETFLAERLPEISIRQAQNYMRVARELPVEKRTGSFLTIKGALRMLEAPDEEPIPKKKYEPDNYSMVDYYYGIFIENKSELLNKQIKFASSADWLAINKDVTDNKPELRNHALNVINQPSVCKKDVLSKLMVLTIILDGSNLPIGKAMSTLMAVSDYKESIKILDDCIELKPDNSDVFIEVRSELKRYYGDSVRLPF